MKRSEPPFRADHVGSFLRPAALKEARAEREQGRIPAAKLAEIENREIEKVIKKQEEAGLELATDGEFRRAFWRFDFFGMLNSVEICGWIVASSFRACKQAEEHPRHRQDRLLQSPPILEHFKFLESPYPALRQR